MPTARRCGHDDAVRVEGGSRADDGAQVARVGHAVQRHDQRRPARVAGEVEQVVGVRVVVRRHLQADALVQRALGHPVELGLADLEQRQPAVGGQLHGLGDPLVGRALVAPVTTYSAVAGICARSASTTGLRPSSSSGPPRRARRARARSARCRWHRRPPGAAPGCPGRASAGGVAPAAGERPAVLAAGPRGRGLLAGTGRAAAALAVAGHQRVSSHRGPWGVSSTETPRLASWSRIASAAAKSLRARAACRCSSASETRPSVDVGQLLVAAAGRPLRVERVQAEDAEHRAHRAERAGHRGVVAVGQRGVALADGLVDRGDRGRGAEVVVHRGGELGAQHRVAGVGARPARRPGGRRTRSAGRPTPASSSAASVNSIVDR